MISGPIVSIASSWRNRAAVTLPNKCLTCFGRIRWLFGLWTFLSGRTEHFILPIGILRSYSMGKWTSSTTGGTNHMDVSGALQLKTGTWCPNQNRKSVVKGKSVYVSVDLGVRRFKTKN